LTFTRTLKRIRLDKTNYRKRAAIIIGRHSFATVRVTDQNVSAQVTKATPTGDIVIASAHSHELTKHGWKGTTNNLPACYLTGLLLGKKALEKGVNKAVLYIGKEHFTTRIAACAKGIADAGVNLPISEDSAPSDERITGQHIADYANSLKADELEYKSRFSALLKNGLKPEDYPVHFEEVRLKISGKPAERKIPKEKKDDGPKKEGKPKTSKGSKKEPKADEGKGKEGKKKK
jgi:large subunit ribosomal protein L18